LLDFCFSNPNRKWLDTSPRNPKLFVDDQENFTGILPLVKLGINLSHHLVFAFGKVTNFVP
jgi:hypothetical protein